MQIIILDPIFTILHSGHNYDNIFDHCSRILISFPESLGCTRQQELIINKN